MEPVDRPHGWTLLQAISELQTEIFRTVFAASAKAGHERDHGRQVAWEGIAPQLERGDLHATGVPPQGRTPEVIHPGFASAALPGFEANTLTLNGASYAGVRIRRGSGEKSRVESTSRSPLSAADMKLFPEWRALVAQGCSGWTAAARLAPRALGGGTEDSKTKRLHDRFTQLKSSTQF